MKDSNSKAVFTDVVPQKGANAYAIKRMVQNPEILGYGRLILKNDQELAIIALKKAVRDNKHKPETWTKTRFERTVSEVSVPLALC